MPHPDRKIADRLLTLWSFQDYDDEFNNWSWDAVLERLTDGSCRATLTQSPGAPGEEDWVAAQQDSLSDGSELFDFLRHSLREFASTELDEAEWRRLAELVGQQDKELADEFGWAVDEEFHPQEFTGPPTPPTQLQICATAAKWQPYEGKGGGAMWAAIAHGTRLRGAVYVYAARHLAEHGVVPQGQHRVRLAYGPQVDADFLCPIGREVAGVVDELVQFQPIESSPADDKAGKTERTHP